MSYTSIEYQYEPLPTVGSIRLLSLCDDLHPEPSTGGKPLLQLRLEVVDLNDPPEFATLSYTWGSPFPEGNASAMKEYDPESSKLPIIINGQIVSITKNLYEFLVQRQAIYPIANKRLRLWIDSICINQQDIPERNAQVAMMSRIYSAASMVIIWMGVEDEYTRPARDALDDPESEGVRLLMYYAVTRREVANVSAVGISQYHGLVNFFRRRWFQRVWVIQEMVLARQIRMFCGTVEFSMTDILLLLHLGREKYCITGHRPYAEALESGRNTRVPGREVSIMTDLRVRIANDCPERVFLNEELGKRKLPPMTQEKPSIQALVRRTWLFDTTDPRDKIFGLLGISRSPDDPAHTIVADYSMSAVEVFVQFARVFMLGSPEERIPLWQTGGSEIFECLEGLSYIQYPRDTVDSTDWRSELPSWVPDFTSPLPRDRLWSAAQRAGIRPGLPNILPSSDPRILCLNSVFHDEVLHVESNFGDTGYDPKEWLQLISRLDPNYISGGSRVQALCWTLMTNHYPPSVKDPYEETRSSFKDFMAQSLWRVSRDPELQELLDTLRETDTSDSLPSNQHVESYLAEHEEERQRIIDRNWESFDFMFSRYYPGRSLFTTKKGYLGLGPSYAQPGDEVWVMAGARMPFILRKAPEKDGLSCVNPRKFIGESYVHGIMRGEMVKSDHPKFDIVSLI